MEKDKELFKLPSFVALIENENLKQETRDLAEEALQATLKATIKVFTNPDKLLKKVFNMIDDLGKK